MKKKLYDVTLYYYKKVEVYADSEQDAIEKARIVLGLDKSEIGAYFFTPKVHSCQWISRKR